MAENSAKARLPKTKRVPEAFANRRLTDRSLEIIKTIARYRFITSSGIVGLVGGNEDVTYRHLQHLYHRSLIGRMKLPVNSGNSEFIYFLDNIAELRALAASGRLPGTLDFEQIRQNRAKYSGDGEQSNRSIGRLLFVEHELMISQFHAAVELAGATSDNRVVLNQWQQGPDTWGRVQIPPQTGLTESVLLPYRPDAYFVLRFLTAPDGQQLGRFFYEADRDTSNATRFRLKLVACLYFFLSGAFAKKYSARKVRAVLIETTNLARLEQLKKIAFELSLKEPLAAPLFWFATSDLIRERGIFSAIWSSAGDSTPRSLLD